MSPHFELVVPGVDSIEEALSKIRELSSEMRKLQTTSDLLCSRLIDLLDAFPAWKMSLRQYVDVVGSFLRHLELCYAEHLERAKELKRINEETTKLFQLLKVDNPDKNDTLESEIQYQNINPETIFQDQELTFRELQSSQLEAACINELSKDPENASNCRSCEPPAQPAIDNPPSLTIVSGLLHKLRDGEVSEQEKSLLLLLLACLKDDLRRLIQDENGVSFLADKANTGSSNFIQFCAKSCVSWISKLDSWRDPKPTSS